MTVEQTLAIRKIHEMLSAGYSKSAAITQAIKLVESQGFSKEHSKKTAQLVAELV